MVTRGLEAPDKINIFTSSVQWIVQPSQCFVNIATLKMATKCHEDGVQNTLTFNDICRGFCAPSFSKFYFLEKNCFSRQFFSSVANSWNKSLSTLFFLHAYWYAWLNNCGLGRPSTRVFIRPQMKPSHHVHSLSICCVPATLLCPRFFPRIFRVNSERQCLTCSAHEETYQLMYHEKCTAYGRVCHFMYMNHKQTYQLMHHEKCTAYQHVYHFMYIHEPWGNISTHVPRKVHSVLSTRMSLQWRWTINSILSWTLSHPPTPPKAPQPTPSVSTPMSLHEDEP